MPCKTAHSHPRPCSWHGVKNHRMMIDDVSQLTTTLHEVDKSFPKISYQIRFHEVKCLVSDAYQASLSPVAELGFSAAPVLFTGRKLEPKNGESHLASFGQSVRCNKKT